jgi:hypothetical protein
LFDKPVAGKETVMPAPTGLSLGHSLTQGGTGMIGKTFAQAEEQK